MSDLQKHTREQDELKISLDIQVDKLKKEKISFIEQLENLTKEHEQAKVELRDLRLFKLEFKNQIKSAKMGENSYLNRVSGSNIIDNRLNMKSNFLDLDQLRKGTKSQRLNNNSFRGRSRDHLNYNAALLMEEKF